MDSTTSSIPAQQQQTSADVSRSNDQETQKGTSDELKIKANWAVVPKRTLITTGGGALFGNIYARAKCMPIATTTTAVGIGAVVASATFFCTFIPPPKKNHCFIY